MQPYKYISKDKVKKSTLNNRATKRRQIQRCSHRRTDRQSIRQTKNGSDNQINTIRPTDIRIEGQLEERTDRRTNRYTCKGYITDRKADQSYGVWTN